MTDPRNPDIRFDPERQAYQLSSQPEITFRRCSEFVESFFEPFEGEEIAEKLVLTNAKYKGRTVQELLDEWKAAGASGTQAHHEIQHWVQGGSEPVALKAQRGARWLDECYPSSAYTRESEVTVCDPTLRLAGTADMLVRPLQLDLWTLIDWKTNKKIYMEPFRGKRGQRGPARAWPDCNYFKYSLQLSLYRYLLETRRGMRFDHMKIVHLTDEAATPISCPYHRSYIEQLLDCDIPRPDLFAGL